MESQGRPVDGAQFRRAPVVPLVTARTPSHTHQPAANPESHKVSDYAAFDFLRFVLASVVALNHLGLIAWDFSGNLAVQVFFALSGWLIGGILFRTRAPELCRFYYNRSTRIWIPYFACVAVLYLVSAIHEPVRSSRWGEFLGYDLTFTHNWFSVTPDLKTAISQMPLNGTGNHFWSLAVEEQFYLVAPLIITLLPIGRNILLWVGIALLACLTSSQYGAVSLGVLAAMAAGAHPNWHRTSISRWALIVLIVSTGGAMVLVPRAYDFVAPLFAVAVVLTCAQPLRRSAVSRWLGGISFPFYLNAWIGIFVFHALAKHFGIHDDNVAVKIVEFLCALGAGAVAYQLIDVQVMGRRDAFYRRGIGWAVGATGYVLILSGTALWVHLWRP